MGAGSDSKSVSVIITTWQRAAALSEVLASLKDQNANAFDVVVVSDGEDLATRDLAAEFSANFPLQWIFHPNNLGLSAARNTGAAAARGDVVLFLDDDCPCDPGLVASHAQYFRADARIAVCGRLVENPVTPPMLWTDKYLQAAWEKILEETRSAMSAEGAESVGEGFERKVFFGVNCSIRRSDFLRSGGFNPKLRYLEEEMEFGLRLFREGVRFVFAPDAVARHRNTKSMTGYYRRAWYLGGQADCMRVLELGERNPQTRQLTSMQHGTIAGRMMARWFHHSSGAMRLIANALESAANRTGSRALFGVWARTARPAEYWGGVKDYGFAPEKLKGFAGEPQCALMLHSLSKPESNQERTYYLSPSRFERYMQWMKNAGYTSVSLSAWKEGSVGRNGLLLTFDDGYDDLFTELLPLVVRYGLRPLVFLISDPERATNDWDHRRGLRLRKLLRKDQIREMQAHGVEFGSHTASHPWLPGCSDAELRREVHDSKQMLEDQLGSEVTTFAYPFGGVDQRVRAAVAEAGYQMAFTVTPGLNFWNDPLCLKRADVNEDVSLLDFYAKLRSGYSVREWLGVRMRGWETGLPTGVLRSGVKTLHGAAGSMLRKRASEQADRLAPPR